MFKLNSNNAKIYIDNINNLAHKYRKIWMFNINNFQYYISSNAKKNFNDSSKLWDFIK